MCAWRVSDRREREVGHPGRMAWLNRTGSVDGLRGQSARNDLRESPRRGTALGVRRRVASEHRFIRPTAGPVAPVASPEGWFRRSGGAERLTEVVDDHDSNDGNPHQNHQRR